MAIPQLFQRGTLHSSRQGESGKSILKIDSLIFFENRFFNNFFFQPNNFNFQVLTRIILSTQCFALCNQNVTALVHHFNHSGSPK